jgi:hypothetical protein
MLGSGGDLRVCGGALRGCLFLRIVIIVFDLGSTQNLNTDS